MARETIDMSKLTIRQHPIYETRRNQLRLNRLVLDGGRPYIEARLWRAPNETDPQWLGDAKEHIVGRIDRTCLVNDAARIAAKIRQYIFKKNPERAGADENWLANCGGDGTSINRIMENVCDAITSAGWAWLQVDIRRTSYDENGNPIPVTLLNKPSVYWRLWEALDVPDWSIDDDGTIRWLITRSKVYINSDPLSEPQEAEISTLYHLDPADGHLYVTEETDKPVPFELRTRQVVPGLDRVPFVIVGKPSQKPWWFDDVENIQAQIMNYDSMYNETLTDACYPQLVVPMSLLNTLQTDIKIESLGAEQLITLQRDLIKGRKNPFYENAEDKGITRYINGATGDTSLTTEEDRKRRILFDSAGLALFNRETRQVQTAESKEFDQLDTNATLGNRALILQEVEKKAVELSVFFDSTFNKFEPVYNQKFDVVDVPAVTAAITAIANLPNATPTMRRIMLRAEARMLLECGACTEEEYNTAVDEINALPDDQLINFNNPFSNLFDEDDDDEGEEGDEGKEGKEGEEG